MDNFSALDRLHVCQTCPGRCHAYKLGGKPLAEECANYLENVLASDTGFNSPKLVSLLEETAANCFGNTFPFTNGESKQFSRGMGKNRCADANGVLADFFMFGTDDLHHRLVTLCDDMIQSGRVGEPCLQYCLMLKILKKRWRPIAILIINFNMSSN